MDSEIDKLLEETTKRNAVIITSDLCLGCANQDVDTEVPVIVSIKVKLEEKEFPAVCIFLCKECSVKQNTTIIKNNLTRFSLEGFTHRYV